MVRPSDRTDGCVSDANLGERRQGFNLWVFEKLAVLQGSRSSDLRRWRFSSNVDQRLRRLDEEGQSSFTGRPRDCEERHTASHFLIGFFGALVLLSSSAFMLLDLRGGNCGRFRGTGSRRTGVLSLGSRFSRFWARFWRLLAASNCQWYSQGRLPCSGTFLHAPR